MFWAKMDTGLESLLQRIKSAPARWEYAGVMNTYRLVIPGLRAEIRSRVISKDVVFALDLMDSTGKPIGRAGADSDSPLYPVLSELFLTARHQAGNPYLDEVLDSLTRP